jgi:hypothetical protein
VLDSVGAVTFRTVVGSPGFDVEAWDAAVKDAVSFALDHAALRFV